MIRRSLVVVCAALLPMLSVAAEPDLQQLTGALGGRAPDAVAETPVPGLYEILVDGQVLYLSQDGRFVVQGALIDLETRANLTERRADGMRKQLIDGLAEANMVVFSPPEGARHYVSVFTDIDCGYCRKLHAEIEDYLAEGIEVRYLAFPRTGLGTESHRKAEAVWCADDRQMAMTRAKRGEHIELKTCAGSPVESQYRLGGRIGISGTPAIILEDGRLVPGYVPAERLSGLLEQP